MGIAIEALAMMAEKERAVERLVNELRKQRRESVMELIRDRDGNVIHSSRNLAGIRRYVSNHLVDSIAIDKLPDEGEGKLSILFDNGASFETTFASHSCLRAWVLVWRNVYGAPLWMDGKECGLVARDNPALTYRD